VHQDVGALREGGKRGKVSGVTGKHDGLSRKFELESEALGDRRMMIAQRRHLDVTRRHNRTFGIFVNVDELAQVWPALVGDAGLDVEFVGVPEPLCELLHASRAVGVDRGTCSARRGEEISSPPA
jgi:hypothetical protein